MSVTFANVTAVKIPQGDVTKIQETSGQKRVLWEKKNNDILMLITMTYANSSNSVDFFSDSAKTKNHPNYGTGEIIDNGVHQIIVNGTRTNVGFPCTFITKSLTYQPIDYISGKPAGSPIVYDFSKNNPIVSVGDKFTAFSCSNLTYITGNSVPTHKVKDATWEFSKVRIWPAQFTVGGINEGPFDLAKVVESSNCPIKLSAYSGDTVTITSINEDLSSYVSAYEASDQPKSFPKGVFRFIRIVFDLTVTSKELGVTITETMAYKGFAIRK